jgi:hypothetical protein
MRRGGFLIAVVGLAAWSGAALARPPIVVELYTAQGCASCSKASAHVADLASDKDVLPLTFDVDYWDYLGWKDTLAKPEFTDRQKAYARQLGVAEVYTPQVVVDGRAQTAGVRPEDIDRLVREARRVRLDPPEAAFGDAHVDVGGGRHPSGGADVWLVRYDPHEQTIEVKDADNRGHSVVERNAVVQFEKLGEWKGRPKRFKLPAAPADNLDTVVLLQAKDGGRILGVWRDAKDRDAKD